MENDDIARSGYHDTHDSMKNIDLDYAAAVTAIAIKTITELALRPDLSSAGDRGDRREAG